MRTTALRLERRRTEDAEQAINLLQRHFEDLASSVLAAGRERGYLGGDPMGALESLRALPPQDLRMLRQIGELWRAFFASFRPDEVNFEAARFETDASDVNDRLASLAPGVPPDGELALAMLDTLVVFWDERQKDVSQRIDTLINDLSEHQQKLGSADLERAHQADELERSTRLVATALVELGHHLQGDEPLSELLAHLVRHWRGELTKRTEALQALKTEQQALLRSLHSAASGKCKIEPELSEASTILVSQVADIVAGFREQEQTLKHNEKEKNRLLAELSDRDQIIAKRDELIARYEFEEADNGNEDQRLELYRQAIAAWEKGVDPSAYVEQVRILERVVVTDDIERNKVMVLIDRHLEGVAKTLQQLRKIIALTEDPKRYRPRLLGSGPYNLKSLRGLMQASRDAGRDLQVYIDRARWAAGTMVMAKQLPRLKKVFKEMVRFIGDCRDKIGGPPPASLTMSMATVSGLASLPAVLAVDVKALSKARGGKSILPAVQELLEECVSMFHGVCERARGERIPRIEAPKREAVSKAVIRLADELLDLSGLVDTTFAEAKDNDWQLAQAEVDLLEQEHVLLLGLRDLDALTEAALHLKGAPTAKMTTLPSGRRSDLHGLSQAVGSRVRWLEDVARYRFQRAKTKTT